MDISKFISQVESTILEMGGILKGPLNTDGNFHRLGTRDKPSSKNISYWIRLDNKPNAYIENHATGQKETLSGEGSYSAASAKDIAKAIENNKHRQAQQAEQKLIEGKTRAQSEWQAASADLVSNHAYIVNKRICESVQQCLKVDKQGRLLLPYFNIPDPGIKGFELFTLTYIEADGSKKFMPGGVKSGTCLPLGDIASAEIIAITESVANAAAIVEATSWAAFSAGSAGELEKVAKRAKERWTTKQIVIVGDNDFSKENNPGKDFALKAGKALMLPVILPEFNPADTDPNGKAPSDIWDLFYIFGFAKSRLAKYLNDRLLSGSFPGLNFTSIDNVQAEKLTWLWPGVIPDGSYSVLAGQPGCGKSQIVASIAAAVSTGGYLPANSGKAPVGGVLLFDAEDNVSKTIKPRLMAAGADESRIVYMKGVNHQDGSGKTITHGFNLLRDLNEISRMVKLYERSGRPIRLIIYDPLPSYLHGDANNNSEVRTQLQALSDFAESYNVAVLGIMHTNKASGGGNTFSAIDRIAGAGAFTQVARSSYMAVKDPQDHNRRLLLPVKVNIGPDGSGFAYKVEEKTVGNEIVTSRVIWEKLPIIDNADAILAQTSKKRLSKIEVAIDFLRGRLADGPVSLKTLENEAEADKISKPTLYRAREALGITGETNGDRTTWALPVSEFDALIESEHDDV